VFALQQAVQRQAGHLLEHQVYFLGGLNLLLKFDDEGATDFLKQLDLTLHTLPPLRVG